MNARRLLATACALFLAAAPAVAETLTLEACLREVVERNPEIARARAEVERAQGQRLVFRARALPRLRLDVGAGYQGSRGEGRPATAFAGLSANASQPLFDAAVPASLRRGELEVLIARQNLYQTVAGRLHLARLTYLALQRRRAIQEIELRTVGRLEENARIQGGLETAGLGARRATLQAQIQRLAIEPQRAANAGELARLTASLRELLGRPATAGDPQPVGFSAVSVPSFRAAELHREALERRPDLVATRAAILASANDQRIIEAAWFPLLELRLGGTLVPQNDSAQSNPNAIRATDASAVTEFRYGVALSWVPFDGGATLGQSRNQTAVRATLTSILLRAEQQIPLDLGRVQARVQSIRARRADAAAARSAASQSIATINDLLRAGKTSQLEVLNAQSSLLEAELNELNASADAAEAAAELDRIAGRYLRFVAQ